MTNEAVCLSLVHTDNEPPQRSSLAPLCPVDSRERHLSVFHRAISPPSSSRRASPRLPDKIAYFKHTWLPSSRMSFRLIDAVISVETDGLTDSRKLGTGRRGGREEAAKGRRRTEFAIWRWQREMVRRNFADFAGFRGGRGGTLYFRNS